MQVFDGYWFMTLSCEQLRAARAVLRWPLTKLARQAGVSHATIQRAETKPFGRVPMTPLTERAVRATLEAANIEFLPTDGLMGGIRWGVNVKSQQ